MPSLPELVRLDLSENRISGNLEQLQVCPKIEYLNLAGNKISSLEALEPLKKLENLKSLDLFGCEISNGEEYREKVFEVCCSCLQSSPNIDLCIRDTKLMNKSG